MAVCLLMTGCSDEQTDDDSYKVFSNGTYVEQEEPETSESSSYDFAEFYIPDGMINSYYSDSLSESEKELYDELQKVLGSLDDKTPLKTDATVYEKVLRTIRVEKFAYPHVKRYWTEYDGGTFDVAIAYRMTADEISSMNMAAEKEAKKIIAQLSPEMDDYEKLKFFHDYLILNCKTDTIAEGKFSVLENPDNLDVAAVDSELCD